MTVPVTTPTPIGEPLPPALPSTPTPAPAPTPEASSPPATPPAAPAPARMEDVLRQLAGQTPPAQDAPAPTPPPAADALTVTLPPRREGEEPIAFVAQTAEQAEALRRLNNGYTRGEEARAIREEATRQLAEQEAFIQRIATDPAGVVLEHLPAGARAHLLEALIATHYEDVKPVLERLYENAEELANARASITDKRTEWGKQAEVARAEAARKVAVEDAVLALVPADAADSHAVEEFGNYAMRILNAEEAATPGSVTPERVQQLLGGLASRWFATATPAADQGRSTVAPAPAAPPAPASVPAPGATVNPQVIAQRAAARAIAPQGAGAAPTTMPAPPKGQTIEQRARWYREQLAAQAAR